LQHRPHGLVGEGRTAKAVSATLQTNDQTIADQLVVAARLQRSDVLDAGGVRHGRWGNSGECRRRQNQCEYPASVFHRAITCIVPSPITVPLTMTPESVFRTRMRSPTEASWRGMPAAEIVMLPMLKESRTDEPRRTA
jgi:hypothetical protein